MSDPTKCILNGFLGPKEGTIELPASDSQSKSAVLRSDDGEIHINVHLYTVKRRCEEADRRGETPEFYYS